MSVCSQLRKSETSELFDRLHKAKDASAREALILTHQGLAVYLARKFVDRGEPIEDIIQVAQVGLIKAVDGYDPSRGFEFTTYATPMIIGEIKRYFRDKVWPLHVPRRIHELNYSLMRAVDELSQQLGRSPTITELAQEVGAPFDAVIEAIEAGKAYSPLSLDADGPEGDGDADRRAALLAEFVGGEDAALDRIEDRNTLVWALEQLPDRLRQIVHLRFHGRLSQAEIGQRLGISQMHVSRQLREALGRLRALIASDGKRVECAVGNNNVSPVLSDGIDPR